MQRAIHIFPHFVNENVIQELREKYDPLHTMIEPHITLVFPFESDISAIDMERHVQCCVSGMQPFHIELQGVTGANGGYLFLNVKHGNDEIIALHDLLYTGPLRSFLNRSLTFIPHLTIGRIGDEVQFQSALKTTESLNEKFETTVSAVYVEVIAETGASTIEFVVEFF